MMQKLPEELRQDIAKRWTVPAFLSEYQKILSLTFLTGTILLLSCLGVFSTIFFRDYSIVFEGGYRIFLGQVPYRDFFIPTGPVVFYMQALFNFIFGVNLWASAVHSGVLAATLAAVYYGMSAKRLGNALSVIMSLLMFFSFNGVINYPWYNTTAYFFFLLNAMMLVEITDREKLRRRHFISSACLTVLSLFSKQDTGMLQFAALSAYFLLYYRSHLKTFLRDYLGGVVLLSVLVIAGYQSVGNFLYWFDYGQHGHVSKLNFFLESRPYIHWQFFSLVALGASLFLRRISVPIKKRLFLCCVLIGVPFITRYTSGCWKQTRLEGIPVILYLIYDVLETGLFHGKSFGDRYRRWMRWVVVAAAIVWINPFDLTGRYLAGAVLTQPQFDRSQWAMEFKNDYGLYGYRQVGEGSYKQCLMIEEDLAGLRQIRKTLAEYPGRFFNMSEYSFLYVDFKVVPPAGLPLWFHHGTSFYDSDIRLLRDYVMMARPQVIVLQDAHTHQMRSLKVHLYNYYLKHGYQKLYHVLAPANFRIDVLALSQTR